MSDCRCFHIGMVLDREQADSLRVGGAGMFHAVRVGGMSAHLFCSSECLGSRPIFPTGTSPVLSYSLHQFLSVCLLG